MSNGINIINQDGVAVVSSRVIAEDFGKRHNDVVRSIENLTAENCVVKNMFIESEFIHRGNAYKEYLLTRDGFSLLVMGFTGKEALQWKLQYIEAFNKMEEKIKQNSHNPYIHLSKELQAIIMIDQRTQELAGKISTVESKVNQLESESYLSSFELEQISKKVKSKAFEVIGGEKNLAYETYYQRVISDIYHELRRNFDITSYKASRKNEKELAYSTTSI